MNLEPIVERRAVRQCPACRHTWPADWDYCADCVVWLRGTERTEPVVRLVPVAGAGPAAIPEATLAACEVRCDSEHPTPAHIRSGQEAIERFRVAVKARGAGLRREPGRGLLAGWTLAAGVDPAVDAVAAVLAGTERPPRGSRGVALGIGIATGATARELAVRLASLAMPDRALVCERTYERAADRFDFRGVGPVVPHAAPLPGPVFGLLGRKRERSGTHHVGPERLALVGRRDMLEAIDMARQATAAGGNMALHLIGEPGLGKSKILREWLSSRQREGVLNAWLQLHAHGVPYGDYPTRGWTRLIATLGGAQSSVIDVDRVARLIAERRRPTLIVVDDLHWLDPTSRDAIEALLTSLAGSPVLSILAYRPSFTAKAPAGAARDQRRFRLAALDDSGTRDLVTRVAERDGQIFTAEIRDDIVTRSRGNPLYVEEAVQHVLEAAAGGGPPTAALPSSLAELLVRRIGWTAEHALPLLEREMRDHRLLGGIGLAAPGQHDAIMAKLDALEEQLAAWLDRFDVVDEQPMVAAEFLDRLERIDGTLALQNLLLGRQRPHRHRLTQARRRLDGR